MTRIFIYVDEQIAGALFALSEKEFRDPQQQAAVILRDELARRGLLTATAQPAQSEQAQSEDLAKGQAGPRQAEVNPWQSA